MSEHLVIRLPSREDQVIHWLIWSTEANEIMGSGELSAAQALSELTQTAATRSVNVLIPAGDLHLRRVEVENKMKRQLKQALPYMLEEELAGDVELLHFAQLHDEPGAVVVAITEREKMDRWLSWLKEANIQAKKMLPDVLALPYYDGAWTALQLDEHWIVRTGFALGISAEPEWLELLLQPLTSAEGDGAIPVHCFSAAPQAYEADWQLQEEALPMQLLAQGAIGSRFNLLQGRYQPKREYSALLLQWRKVAIVAVLALLLSLVNKGLMLNQIADEQASVREQIHQVHRILFPEIKRIRDTRIRSTMKKRLKLAKAGGGDTGFLAMFAQLTPAFKEIPELHPESLKFDEKRHEIRLSGRADSFQVFERFKVKASEHFTVEQGSLSNHDGKVTGTLVIRGRS